MKDGPDISITAALIGDPARANMVMALMSGYSLTMGELAAEAGVTLSTASIDVRRPHWGRGAVAKHCPACNYVAPRDPIMCPACSMIYAAFESE